MVLSAALDGVDETGDSGRAERLEARVRELVAAAIRFDRGGDGVALEELLEQLQGVDVALDLSGVTQ